MEHASISIGDVEVSVVCEGYAPLALSEESPGIDWAAERAANPWAFHDDASWAWHVHAFALRTPTGLVMVDTGLGAFPPYRPWAVSTPPDDAVAAAGVDRAEVRLVVHTHVHVDHAGGAVVDGEPRFPNARHVVHPADREYYAETVDEEDYVAIGGMRRLEELGMLDVAPEDREVWPGIDVVHSPGHTPGHRSVIARSGDRGLLLTGDLLHTPVQVAQPSMRSTHDVDPGLACGSRVALLALARFEGLEVAVTHFADPFGRVGDRRLGAPGDLDGPEPAGPGRFPGEERGPGGPRINRPLRKDPRRCRVVF